MKVYLLLVMSILIINPLVMAFDTSDFDFTYPTTPINYSTVSSNHSLTSDFAQYWITNEGNLDNIPDLYPTTDLRYLELDGSNANTNIDIGIYNITANTFIGSNGLFSNRVGIGTTSPEAKLHVQTASSGASPNAVADDFIIESSISLGISMLTADYKDSRLAFGYPSDNDLHSIIGYGPTHSTLANNMLFKVGGSNRMIIDDSGNVGIGTTSPMAKLDVNGSAIIRGDLNVSGYVDGKNYVTQYHRNTIIDTTSANTWVNITWDLTIDDETTSGYSLTDSNTSIIIENDGIYRIQGCLHPKNNGVGNQEANLYSRVLINGVEAKCLQFSNSKEFKTTGIDTMPFTGTIYAEAGQKVQLQYYVTNINLDFEGDDVFDEGVAGSINFERISK